MLFKVVKKIFFLVTLGHKRNNKFEKKEIKFEDPKKEEIFATTKYRFSLRTHEKMHLKFVYLSLVHRV
jgi:hypothetical protein